MNTVFLEDSEAELFKVFLQHYDFISIVLQQLPVKNGSVSLYFDEQGLLKSVKKDFYTYRA